MIHICTLCSYVLCVFICALWTLSEVADNVVKTGIGVWRSYNVHSSAEEVFDGRKAPLRNLEPLVRLKRRFHTFIYLCYALSTVEQET